MSWATWIRHGWIRRPGCGRRGAHRPERSRRRIRSRRRWMSRSSPASPRRKAASCCRPGRCASPPEHVCPIFRASRRVTFGCRTPPLRCRPGCWRRSRASGSPICVPRLGGKTGQLAAAGAVVTAVERDPGRIERLTANLARWHLHADVINADATSWTAARTVRRGAAGCPCSATGTIRRHPDVARIKRPRDVQTVTQAQDKLLEAAAGMLRPGGRLIYAVCSLQPEEGAPRVAAAARFGLRHDPFRPEELSAFRKP